MAHLFDITKQREKFFIKKSKKIWWSEKKIVTLHDFSRIVGIAMEF